MAGQVLLQFFSVYFISSGPGRYFSSSPWTGGVGKKWTVGGVVEVELKEYVWVEGNGV